MDGWLFGWVDECLNEFMDWWMDTKNVGFNDKWINGMMESQMHVWGV